jgi:hypothetical protein
MQDYTESLQITRRSNNSNEVKQARATLRILQRFVDEVRARRGAPQTERWTDPTRIP